MTTLQNWLNQKYPTKTEKAEVKIIGLRDSKEWKNLEGDELDLREFVGLEKIYINGDALKTPLKKINLTGIGNLETLFLNANELTSVDFLNQLSNPEKLKTLNLARNNFSPTTLDFVRPFTNLKLLTLGTKKEKVQAGIYNRFYGSLEPLKNLTHLSLICIASTDVDRGLEYLPLTRSPNVPEEKLTPILDCRPQVPQAKVRTLKEELKPFNYDVWAWQLAHPEKMRKVWPEYFTEKGQWEKQLTQALTKAEKEFTENQHNSNLKPKNIERLKSRLKLLQEAQVNYLRKPFSPPNWPKNNSQLNLVKTNIKNKIQTELDKYNLKNADLGSKFANWERFFTWTIWPSIANFASLK